MLTNCVLRSTILYWEVSMGIWLLHQPIVFISRIVIVSVKEAKRPFVQ